MGERRGWEKSRESKWSVKRGRERWGKEAFGGGWRLENSIVIVIVREKKVILTTS